MNCKTLNNVEALISGIKDGNRMALAKAITLVESEHSEDAQKTVELLIGLKELGPKENTIRVGISGPPGVGKSTFIEAFGLLCLDKGHKVAVIAIDPSSPISKGSLLADKTRMPKLSHRESAFIRPIPARGALGGVSKCAWDVVSVLESFGFDFIMVETLGVGQAEFLIHALVDQFVLLFQPGAGDSLQALKKGIMELSDFWVVNKADGAQKPLAQKTAAELNSILRGFSSFQAFQNRRFVFLISALAHEGLEPLYEALKKCHEDEFASQSLFIKRQKRAQEWFDFCLNQEVIARFNQDAQAVKVKSQILDQVIQGHIPMGLGIRRVLDGFFKP